MQFFFKKKRNSYEQSTKANSTPSAWSKWRTFLKVLYIVTLHSKCTRSLTFENCSQKTQPRPALSIAAVAPLGPEYHTFKLRLFPPERRYMWGPVTCESRPQYSMGSGDDWWCRGGGAGGIRKCIGGAEGTTSPSRCVDCEQGIVLIGLLCCVVRSLLNRVRSLLLCGRWTRYCFDRSLLNRVRSLLLCERWTRYCFDRSLLNCVRSLLLWY